MKKKIMFLVLSYHTINFFRPIIKKLIAAGHEVKILAIFELPFGAKEDGFNTKRVNWQKFEFEEIDNFNPDTVVVFNGYFRPIHAATKVLSRMYHTLVAEVAWFPQNDYIYIDKGIHHSSEIAKQVSKDVSAYNLKALERKDHHLKTLVEKYKPGTRPPELKENKLNIIVPLQLERDTSILYASPYFKDMGSLVGFISNTLAKEDVNLIIKPHPKVKSDELEEHFNPTQYPGIVFVKETEHSMNDYAYHCDAVMGINSTSLMEAKLHGKPVYQMGRNVFRSNPDRPDKEALLKFIQDVKEGNPTDDSIERKIALLTMIANQIDFRNPPEWAINNMVRGKTDPHYIRGIKDLSDV